MVLYVIRALALALAEEPALAGRLIGKRLVPAAGVDIGFAVEVDDGLMVPVLRGVDAHAGRGTQRAVPGTRRGGAAASASRRDESATRRRP